MEETLVRLEGRPQGAMFTGTVEAGPADSIQAVYRWGAKTVLHLMPANAWFEVRQVVRHA